MTSKQLWAPWRLGYVTGEKPEGCVFCNKPQENDDEAALIIHRGSSCYVVLNLYPYNNGHTMIVPFRHVAEFTELSDDERSESLELIDLVIRSMKRAFSPEGFNVGLNLGDAAGAGIAAHLHWHIVPRWRGDTNFMPVLAETKVMPQHIQTTRELLADSIKIELDSPSTNDTKAHQ